MGSSAASPFASLASSSSPFASVQPSTEEVKHAALKSTFGAGFSGSSFGSLASPAKKPRTQGHEGEEGQDADDGEAEEARNDASKQKAFGNMLEKEDEGTSSEQQYVQVSQPLVEQDHVTGEETEATVHSIRAKLFVARKEGWKERGVGQVRINIAKEEKMLAPRLVMRADAVFKLLLNAPLFPGMEVQGSGDNSDEGLSSDRFVRMVVFEESKPVTIAFKVSYPFLSFFPLTHSSLRRTTLETFGRRLCLLYPRSPEHPAARPNKARHPQPPTPPPRRRRTRRAKTKEGTRNINKHVVHSKQWLLYTTRICAANKGTLALHADEA